MMLGPWNQQKSDLATFRETEAVHYESMKNDEWILGGNSVDELEQYKNLAVVKNYIDSFSPNAEDNIEKARKKSGMIFSLR